MAEQNAVEEKTLTVQQGGKPPIFAGLRPEGGLIPRDLDQLGRMAQLFHKSGLMPKGLDSAEAVAVAIQHGLEVGLAPMQAVQNIAVINGIPSIWGDAVLGLVRASGLLAEFDEYYEGTFPQDDFKAICVSRRRGTKKQIVREFSIGDAKRAGLWDDKSRQFTWGRYPKRMLQMRARSWNLRDGYGDVLKGLRQAEEVMDMERYEDGVYRPAPEPQPEAELEAVFWREIETRGIASNDREMKAYIAETAEFAHESEAQIMADLGKSFSDPEHADRFVEAFRKKYAQEKAPEKPRGKAKAKAKETKENEEPQEPGKSGPDTETPESQLGAQPPATGGNNKAKEADAFLKLIRPDLRMHIKKHFPKWSNQEIMDYMVETHEMKHPDRMTEAQITIVWNDIEVRAKNAAA